MKRTLVIGNGFDLDAGLKTSYTNFSASEYWPFKNAKQINNNNTLAYELDKATYLDTWFDVEETLYHYARMRMREPNYVEKEIISDDKQSFDKLHDSLKGYLKSEQESFEPNEDSVAAKLLMAFNAGNEENKIYSFNYTNLSHIADSFNYWSTIKADYIHGSIESGHIILGVGDKRELKDNYFYMHKTASHYFKSHGIIPDLLQSDEVIFFGHSLGYNDYPYFMPFFQSALKYNPDRRRKITIFTRDEASELILKRHLFDLTGREVTLLYAMNDFKIFCTADKTQKGDIIQFINHLREEF